MPACRKSLASITLASFLVMASGAFAQSGPSVSAPTVTAPTMPTVTSPTIGSGYYMPGSETNPIYTGAKPIGARNNTSTSSDTSTQKSTESTTEKKIASTLTSSDISTLDNLGLLNQITTLTNTSSLTSSLSSQSLLSNLYTSQNTDTTNLILQNVLKELEVLKKQNENISKQLEEAQKLNNQQYAGTSHTPTASTASPEAVTDNKSTTAASTQTAAASAQVVANKARPRILRFTVNGYSILGTCRSVYISQIQSNGSFLVTGDRKYTSDGKYRTETFHMLFNPNEARNGVSSYTTATAVSQDYLNEYSFLYQLSQRGPLTAQRTGNLVTLRTTDSNWKLEFLLDLGE